MFANNINLNTIRNSVEYFNNTDQVQEDFGFFRSRHRRRMRKNRRLVRSKKRQSRSKTSDTKLRSDYNKHRRNSTKKIRDLTSSLHKERKLRISTQNQLEKERNEYKKAREKARRQQIAAEAAAAVEIAKGRAEEEARKLNEEIAKKNAEDVAQKKKEDEAIQKMTDNLNIAIQNLGGSIPGSISSSIPASVPTNDVSIPTSDNVIVPTVIPPVSIPPIPSQTNKVVDQAKTVEAFSNFLGYGSI